MFKKIPNFLNCVPTSRESVLQLLSAPSIRFWQTAICPVSLWALVVELHLLNWARAQALRWISDKVTMKELEEQRVCVCVWNFAANLVKILQRHFNCLTKHMERTVWAEHSAMSGLSILKTAECQSVKIPGLHKLPHKQIYRGKSLLPLQAVGSTVSLSYFQSSIYRYLFFVAWP